MCSRLLALLMALVPTFAHASEIAIPPLNDTAWIEIEVPAGNSGAYMRINPSGNVTYFPMRTQLLQPPEGSFVTDQPIVNFADIYNQLAPLVIGSEDRNVPWNPEDRIVYFISARQHTGLGLYLPAQHQDIAARLFALATQSPHHPLPLD